MRYLPHTREDVAEMLQVVGAATLDDLFSSIPEDCRFQGELDLPPDMSEWELDDHMAALAGRMAVSPEYRVFLGAGSYDHYIPATVSSLLGRSEFVDLLHALPAGDAPGDAPGDLRVPDPDGPPAGDGGGHGLPLRRRDGPGRGAPHGGPDQRGKKTWPSRAIHPHYRQVVQTYFAPTGYELVEIPCLGRTHRPVRRRRHRRSGRRRRAVAELLRLHRRPPGGGGQGPFRRRAARGLLHRGAGLRAPEEPGKPGRRHRRRRGAEPGHPPLLRGAGPGHAREPEASTCGTCPDASWDRRRTGTGGAASCSRWPRGSSTSAGRRRPRTSAPTTASARSPPRCTWPPSAGPASGSWPPSTTTRRNT